MAGRSPKVVLTRKAEDSLMDIVDYYLLRYSAKRAAKVLESIEDAFEKVGVSPMLYPVCFDIRKPNANIRQIIVHHTFKIVYRIQGDLIEILEIFHGKRNPDLLQEIEG
jgi:plasmid stabilization system protein ParE